MSSLQKRLLVVLSLAVIFVCFSFYGQWHQAAVGEETNFSKASPLQTSKEVTVYICGLVNYPGVIKIAEGSRVADVIELSGGFAPGADIDKVNLAQIVKDGMQVNVPGVGKSGFDKKAVGDKININTADKVELDKLPGIGPSMAEKIIKYREENGGFKKIEELEKVPGIGKAKFNHLKDKVIL